MLWSRPGESPIVCGHRGAPALLPENTIASFHGAVERGATWIEFDVRPTNDGELVIHHDPDTAEGIAIGASPRVALRDDIPTFGDLLGELPTVGLDIEMKTDEIGMSVDAFVDLVLSNVDTYCGSNENVMITSFDAPALAMVRDRRPDIATGLLFWKRTPEWALKTAVEVGHNAIAPYLKLLDAKTMDAAREHGLGVLTWTVNKPEQVQKAIDLDVDMIIGDDPAVIIEHLRSSDGSQI